MIQLMLIVVGGIIRRYFDFSALITTSSMIYNFIIVIILYQLIQSVGDGEPKTKTVNSDHDSYLKVFEIFYRKILNSSGFFFLNNQYHLM